MEQVKEQAAQIISRLKMDQPNYEFDRPDFISSMSAIFKGKLVDYARKREGAYLYPDFNKSVREIKLLWDTISQVKELTHGKPITLQLWKLFFSKTIVPVRKELFPLLQERIEKHHEEKRNR